jgi:hypothetical protein
MDMVDAVKIMDLALASGFPQVRLLGGEPTLHPDFAAILRAAVERELGILVFSNGLMPSEALEAIVNTPQKKCHVMLNLNLDVMPQAGSHISRVAKTLGEQAFIGINIYSPGMPLRKASDFAKAHGLERQIRIGLAHPRLDRQNRYLHPRHYQQVGKELECLFDSIRADGFSLSLDCGFVPCMLTPRFFEVTGIAAQELGCRCGPIPDILPDLTSIHCFPLGELDELPISGLHTFQEIRSMHEQRVGVFKEVGIYKECSQCSVRQNGSCAGGCPSVAMLRSNRTGLTMSGPPTLGPVTSTPSTKAATTVKPWAIPYIDQPVEFWEALHAGFGEAISEVYFPLDLSSDGSGRSLERFVHLRELLDSGTVPMAAVVKPPVLPEPVERIGVRVVDELVSLYEHYGIIAVTLSDLRLAEMARKRLPTLRFSASCSPDMVEPGQVQALGDLFDVLVPSTRLIRRPDHLLAIRAAFPGQIRLLVNEGCLASCLDPKQYSCEMTHDKATPQSLCSSRLRRKPWLRLTGAWVLPQHVDIIDSLGDEFALAGQMALDEPEQYRRVLHAYISRTALWPHEIGGGPASILSRVPVPLATFTWMLQCDHVCGHCSICRRASASQLE